MIGKSSTLLFCLLCGCASTSPRYCYLNETQLAIVLRNLQPMLEELSTNEIQYEVSGRFLTRGYLPAEDGECYANIVPRPRAPSMTVFNGNGRIRINKINLMPETVEWTDAR